jgi:type II secretion system protein I
MENNSLNRTAGFTFIEVMVAMLIFVLAVLAAINITNGSVRATKDARETTVATWLLQNVMVELETRIETEGFDKACDKKKESKFEAPYENYRWMTSCDQIDFKLSQSAAQMAGKDKDDKKNDEATVDSQKEDAITKLILQTASDYITKSVRELHAEVYWFQGKTRRTVDLTTHVADYTQPLVLPGGVPGGSTTSGSGGAGTSTGGSGSGTGTSGGSTSGSGASH